MADLIIRGELAQWLRDIANSQHRPVEDVLWSLVGRYIENDSNSQEVRLMVEAYEKKAAEIGPLEALLAMDGMFDDDVTDLSSITKEDVMEAYRKKYDDSV